MRKDLLSQGFKRIKVKNTYGQTLKTHPFLYDSKGKYSYCKKIEAINTNNLSFTATEFINKTTKKTITGQIKPLQYYKVTFTVKSGYDGRIYSDHITVRSTSVSAFTLFHKGFIIIVTNSLTQSNTIEFTCKFLQDYYVILTNIEQLTIASDKLKQDIVPILATNEIQLKEKLLPYYYTTNTSKEVLYSHSFNNILIVCTDDSIKTCDISQEPPTETVDKLKYWKDIVSDASIQTFFYNQYTNKLIIAYSKNEGHYRLETTDGISWSTIQEMSLRTISIADAKDGKGFFVVVDPITSSSEISETTIVYTKDFVTFAKTNITDYLYASLSDHMDYYTTNKLYYYKGMYYICAKIGKDGYNAIILESSDGLKWSKTTCGLSSNTTFQYAQICITNSILCCLLGLSNSYVLMHKKIDDTDGYNWKRIDLSTAPNVNTRMFPYSSGVMLLIVTTEDLQIYMLGGTDLTVQTVQKVEIDYPVSIFQLTESQNSFLINTQNSLYKLYWGGTAYTITKVLSFEQSNVFPIQRHHGMYVCYDQVSIDGNTWYKQDIFIPDPYSEDEDGEGSYMPIGVTIPVSTNILLGDIYYGDIVAIHCDQALPGYSEVKTYDQL